MESGTVSGSVSASGSASHGAKWRPSRVGSVCLCEANSPSKGGGAGPNAGPGSSSTTEFWSEAGCDVLGAKESDESSSNRGEAGGGTALRALSSRKNRAISPGSTVIGAGARASAERLEERR